MRCRQARRMLVAYQDAELSPGEMTRVSEHLASCASCRAREAHLASVTPEKPPLVRPRMDPDWSRLDAALDSAAMLGLGTDDSRWEAPAPARRTHTSLLVAAGIALGALVGWGLHGFVTADPGPDLVVAATTTVPGDAALPSDAIVPTSWAPTTDDASATPAPD